MNHAYSRRPYATSIWAIVITDGDILFIVGGKDTGALELNKCPFVPDDATSSRKGEVIREVKRTLACGCAGETTDSFDSLAGGLLIAELVTLASNPKSSS
jgi:hypothetical protein